MKLSIMKSLAYSCAALACGALGSVAVLAQSVPSAPVNSANMGTVTVNQNDISVAFTFNGSSNEVDRVCAILDYDRPTTIYVQLPLTTSRRQVQCSTSLYTTSSVTFAGLNSNTKYWLSLHPYKFNGQNYALPGRASGVAGKEVVTAVSATLLPTPTSSHRISVISTETRLYQLWSKFIYEGPTGELDKICAILDYDYTSGYYSVLPEASQRRQVRCIAYEGNYGLIGFEELQPATKYWLSIFPYKKNGDRFVLPANASGIAAQEVMTSMRVEPFVVRATSITDSSVTLIAARPVIGEEQYTAECQGAGQQSPARGYSRSATVPVGFMRPNTSYKCVIYLYSTMNDSVQGIVAGVSREVSFTTLPEVKKGTLAVSSQSSVRSSAAGSRAVTRSSASSSSRRSTRLPDLSVESVKVETKMMTARGGKQEPVQFLYAKIRNRNRALPTGQMPEFVVQYTPVGAARSFDDKMNVSFDNKEYLGGRDQTFATATQTDPWTLIKVDVKAGDLLKFTIDAGNAVRESNERNNSLTYRVQ